MTVWDWTTRITIAPFSACRPGGYYRRSPVLDDSGAEWQRLHFSGLGMMGYPMAGHLLKKGGHDVTVYNRTAAKAQQWAKEYGGKSAPTRARQPGTASSS